MSHGIDAFCRTLRARFAKRRDHPNRLQAEGANNTDQVDAEANLEAFKESLAQDRARIASVRAAVTWLGIVLLLFGVAVAAVSASSTVVATFYMVCGLIASLA